MAYRSTRPVESVRAGWRRSVSSHRGPIVPHAGVIPSKIPDLFFVDLPDSRSPRTPIPELTGKLPGPTTGEPVDPLQASHPTHTHYFVATEPGSARRVPPGDLGSHCGRPLGFHDVESRNRIAVAATSWPIAPFRLGSGLYLGVRPAVMCTQLMLTILR